jgi:hypothetical protein
MPRRPARKPAQPRAAAIDALPDEVPEDIDAFRNMLARQINRLVCSRRGYWRRCKVRDCRRRHACLAPHIQCSNAPPLPPDADGRWRAVRQELLDICERLNEAG